MQRAAASSAHQPHPDPSSTLSTSQSPSSTTPSHALPSRTHTRQEDNFETPNAKRQKRESNGPLSNGSTSSYYTPLENALGGSKTDLQRVQEALDEERAKRDSALEKLAAEAGESRWVLSTLQRRNGLGDPIRGGLKVVRTGYAEIDGSGMEGRRSTGRKKFGDFRGSHEVSNILFCKQPIESPGFILVLDCVFVCVITNGRSKLTNYLRIGSCGQHNAMDVSSQSNSDEDSFESDNEGVDEVKGRNSDVSRSGEVNNEEAEELIQSAKEELVRRARVDRKAQRKAEKARLSEQSAPVKKDVRLDQLGSISGGKGSVNHTGRIDKSKRNCFLCGKIGHEKMDCPRRNQSRDQGKSRHYPPQDRVHLDY